MDSKGVLPDGRGRRGQRLVEVEGGVAEDARLSAVGRVSVNVDAVVPGGDVGIIEIGLDKETVGTGLHLIGTGPGLREIDARKVLRVRRGRVGLERPTSIEDREGDRVPVGIIHFQLNAHAPRDRQRVFQRDRDVPGDSRSSHCCSAAEDQVDGSALHLAIAAEDAVVAAMDHETLGGGGIGIEVEAQLQARIGLALVVGDQQIEVRPLARGGVILGRRLHLNRVVGKVLGRGKDVMHAIAVVAGRTRDDVETIRCSRLQILERHLMKAAWDSLVIAVGEMLGFCEIGTVQGIFHTRRRDNIRPPEHRSAVGTDVAHLDIVDLGLDRIGARGELVIAAAVVVACDVAVDVHPLEPEVVGRLGGETADGHRLVLGKR